MLIFPCEVSVVVLPVLDHGGPDVLMPYGSGHLPVAVDVLLHPA